MNISIFTDRTELEIAVKKIEQKREKASEISYFEDKIFDSREDAENWLELHGDKNYVVEYRQAEENNKMLELHERLKQEKAKRKATFDKNVRRKLAVKLVTCKGCGSRLNSKYIDRYCPLCNSDLFPETAANLMSRHTEKIKKLEYELEYETRRNNMANGEIRYLANF